MGDAMKHTIHRTRHVYTLRSPTNAAEMRKAMHWAEQDMGPERAQWDDALCVESRDDEVIVWWEEDPK